MVSMINTKVYTDDGEEKQFQNRISVIANHSEITSAIIVYTCRLDNVSEWYGICR